MKKPEGGKAKARRPGSVVVAGWAAILAVPLILARMALLFVNGQLAATIAATPTDSATWLSTQGLETALLVLVAPIIIVSLVTGIAILNLKRWAWVVLMSFLVMALTLNLVRCYFQRPEYGLMLIYTALALVLNQPDVRQAFRIGRPAHDPVD